MGEKFNPPGTWGVLASLPDGPAVAYFGDSEKDARTIHDQNSFFGVPSRLVCDGVTIEDTNAGKTAGTESE